MGAKRAHVSKNKTFVGTASTSFGVIGGGCAGATCPAVIGTSTTGQLLYKTGMGNATTAAIATWGFPWTTGTVSVTAPAGPFPTLFKRKGYDDRTPNGVGTIQLVAPQLAEWTFPDRDAPWDRHTGAIAILRIKFIPEPSQLLMLAAGAAMVFALAKLRGGSLVH
jgi:hypothetical protein